MMTINADQRYNKNRADFQCKAYKLGLPALKTVEDIFAGTPRVRACSVEYLPRNPAESDDEYRARLMRSIFPPFFKRALTKLVGLVFAKDPTLKECDAEFGEHWLNIDDAGTPGEVFANMALLAAAKDGHALIYVDMPPRLEQSASAAAEPTAQDEYEAGVRPAWILYKKGQAINWRVEKINGKPKLTLLVLKECTMESDGAFGEAEVTRYRVLRPGSWELFRADGRRAPQYESGGETGLDYIPVYPVYGEECGAYNSEPPLLELALMCVQLYNKQSDLDNILHVANVPVMWARDRNTNVPFQAIGPTILIDLKGEHSEIGYAEHEGKAIAAAQKDIETLKLDMVVAALELLAAQETQGPESATGEIIDAAEANSALALMVKSLQAALNAAKAAHMQMLGRADKGSIELNVQYDRLVLTTEEMRVLKEYAEQHLLSVETLLELLKRAGKLGKDFDVAKELVRIFGPEEAKKPDTERDLLLETERLDDKDAPGDKTQPQGQMNADA